jgi:hypothetical protein
MKSTASPPPTRRALNDPPHTQRDRHRAARCARRRRAQGKALLEPHRAVLIPLRKRPVGVRDTVPIRARRPRPKRPQRRAVANPGQAQRETPAARGNTHTRTRKAGRETLRAVHQHKPGTRAPHPEHALAATQRARHHTTQRDRQARKTTRQRRTRRRARARHAAPDTGPAHTNQRRRSNHRHPGQQRRGDQHPHGTSPRSPRAHALAPPSIEGDRIRKGRTRHSHPDPRRYPRGCQHDRLTPAPPGPGRSAPPASSDPIPRRTTPSADRDRPSANKPADTRSWFVAPDHSSPGWTEPVDCRIATHCVRQPRDRLAVGRGAIQLSRTPPFVLPAFAAGRSQRYTRAIVVVRTRFDVRTRLSARTPTVPPMRGSRGSDRLGGVIGAEGNGSDALSGFSGSRCRDRDIPDEGRAGVGRPGVRRRIAPEPGHGGYLAPLVKTSSPRRPSARRRVLARGRLAAHPSEVAHSRQKQASARGIPDEQGSHQRSLRLVPA